MRVLMPLVVVGLGCLVLPPTSQAREFDLAAASTWQLENVQVRETNYEGQRAFSVRASQSSLEGGREHLAILADSEFKNGTIELELAGKPLATAGPMARGFVGVAFRLQQNDPKNYEAFYLRPTNGRADDQVRRNHAVQYISHPDHTWSKLREEFPGKYESYADLVPGAWTKIKVVVDGTDARLFVGNAEQPCLIVKDLKHGERSGAIAIWIEPSTDAYVRNLRVTDGTAPGPTRDQLVGTWRYVAGIKDGEQLGAEHFVGQSVEFTPDRLTLHAASPDGPLTFVMSYALDTKATPARIKLEILESPFGAGSKAEGIIRFRDGKLQICYPPLGGAAPKEFTAEGGSGYHMFELEKPS